MRYQIDPSILQERERGYLIGLYIGDGNIFIKKEKGVYRLRFFLWKKELRIHERITGILDKLSLNIRKYTDKDNTFVIETHSKELQEFISVICNKNGISSRSVTEDFRKGYLEGLIDSDGYVQRNYVEITTGNEKLMENITENLNIMGINHNIRNYTSPISNRIGWRIGFSLAGLELYPEKWVPSP